MLSIVIIISVILVSQSYGLFPNFELSNLVSIRNSGEYYESTNITSIEEAIVKSRALVELWRTQTGVPGAVFGLTIRGQHFWTEGFGQIDIENNVSTHQNSVFRLASISKPLTTTLVAKLIEQGKLSLDKSIYDYLPRHLLPIKTWNNSEVDITVRQTIAHLAGFHLTRVPDDFAKLFRADNVSQTLELFKNEKLLFRPGSEYSYSNYGYQVIGAIIESILGNTYESAMKSMFAELGMGSTFVERREHILRHRPRYYQKIAAETVNTELMDDLFSYEGWWPSGGLMSTAGDILRFGNVMLDGYLGKKNNYLNSTTVKEFWSNETLGIPKAQQMYGNEYAKGWMSTIIAESNSYPYKHLIWHSGGLLGTSTLLFIFPEQQVVMTGFANLGYVLGMDQVLFLIAQNFGNFIN